MKASRTRMVFPDYGGPLKVSDQVGTGRSTQPTVVPSDLY